MPAASPSNRSCDPPDTRRSRVRVFLWRWFSWRFPTGRDSHIATTEYFSREALRMDSKQRNPLGQIANDERERGFNPWVPFETSRLKPMASNIPHLVGIWAVATRQSVPVCAARIVLCSRLTNRKRPAVGMDRALGNTLAIPVRELAAKALRHCHAEVIVIDRRNHHIFQPLLYQVAAIPAKPPPTMTICGFLAWLGAAADVCSCGRETSNGSLMMISQSHRWAGVGPSTQLALRFLSDQSSCRGSSGDGFV